MISAIDFTFSGTTTIVAGDMITVQFASGSSGNEVGVRTDNTGAVTNSVFRQYTGSWADVSGEALAYIVTYVPTSTIISATGLTDNTSTAQHYAVTRDSSNLWTLYQNGVSQATATDSTSLGGNSVVNTAFDGTNNGATTGQTGKLSNAWEFDGSNDYVQLGDKFNSLHDGTGGSISLWINPDSTNNQDMFYTSTPTSASGSTGGIELKFKTGNIIKIASIDTSNGWITHDSVSTIPINQWTHLVVTWDENYVLKIYLDGALDSSTTTAEPKAEADTTVRLGGHIAGGGYLPYDGKLDQVIIYDKVLSTSEISALYNSGSGTSTPDTTNMKAHYDFEQTGSTLENKATASSDYTTNISGTLDEFFINSDVLTASEISDIKQRGDTTSSYTTSSTSFNDASVVAGSEYFYKIYSISSEGYSVASNVDNAMTVSPANAPTSLTSTVNSNAHIVLDWTASTDLGNGSLISMNIQRDDGTGWSTIATTSSTSPPYTDTTAVTSQTYDFRVASVNEAGVGAYSNTVTATAGIPADTITNVVTTIPNTATAPYDVCR